MKRIYGNFLQRLAWGGMTLTDVEYELLEQLVASLPPPLRSVVETQCEAYNLVQLEVNRRAINFYRKKAGKANNMEGLPLLQMDVDEAPLIRLTAHVSGDSEPLHAVLNAVSGRMFSMNLSRAIPREGDVTVSDVKQARRSNFSF